MGTDEVTEKANMLKEALQSDEKTSEVSSLSSDTGSIDARSCTLAPPTQVKWRQWFSRTNTMVTAVALVLLFFLIVTFISVAIAAAVVIVEAAES